MDWAIALAIWASAVGCSIQTSAQVNRQSEPQGQAAKVEPGKDAAIGSQSTLPYQVRWSGVSTQAATDSGRGSGRKTAKPKEPAVDVSTQPVKALW